MGIQGQRYRALLLRTAAIGLLAGTVAGCSSSFSRFDTGLYASAPPPQAETAASAGAYPEYVDPTTTASVPEQSGSGGALVPPAAVPNGGSSGVYYQQGTSASVSGGNSAPTSLFGRKTVSPTPQAPVSSYSTAQSGQVQSQALPSYTDQTTTGGIIPARVDTSQNSQQAARGPAGWSAANGVPVTVGQGETVYSLSKRYGVPASEIMKANNLSDASQLQAGRQIIIPTYSYGSNVPVSAPDNNSKTQAASVTGSGTTVASASQTSSSIPVPQRAPSGSRQAQTLSAPKAATASTGGGTYTVEKGDTLTRIASAHGVSASQLRAANQLSGDNIRIGQKLVIPTGGATLVATAKSTDAVVTGSTAQKAGTETKTAKAATTKQTELASANVNAPAQTGIGEFRWPVRGRVIANFDDKTASGRNDGIDISVPEGTAVKAAENGVVVYAGSELEGFGNLVLIRHSDGWVSAYAYNKSIEVSRGDEVRRGQVIARSGRSGNADMPKLHFELRHNSVPVDPIKHLGAA